MIRFDLNAGPLAELWRADPCSVLFELARRYPGVEAKLTLGDEEIILVQDAQIARGIAHAGEGTFLKNFAGFLQFFGDSRITRDGEPWRASRDFSQPAISATATTSVAEAAAEFFGETARTLRESGPADRNLDHVLDVAAGRVIGRVTLGFDAEELSSAIADDFRALLRHGALTTWNVAGALHLRDASMQAEAEEARQRLRRGLDAAIEKRRAAAALPPLLAAQETEGLDVFAEICALLFAGFDTSSAALGWALWLLAGAQDLQWRLRHQLLARLTKEPLAIAARQIKELEGFVLEALRIFPPVPILSRITARSTEVGGIETAAGQKVLISVIGLHHDTHWFPQPRRVSLHRFSGASVPRDLRGHFIPFGDGQRACPGGRIATAELAVGIAALIEHLNFERIDDAPLQFEWLASLRRRGGQRLRVRPIH